MDDLTPAAHSPSPGLVLHLQVEEQGRIQVVCFNSAEEARVRDWLESASVEEQAAELVRAARAWLDSRAELWLPGDLLPDRSDPSSRLDREGTA